ncbi:MAG: VacJ family lipoprotein [Noviherbaspirillum sp.]|nr:VacJ family lipoprotein [Noviherbaspirillum sp.]
MSSASRIGMVAIALALAGCATTDSKDPLEKFNRAMFSFNDTVDKAALKPAAEAYSTLPSFVQVGVSNFFGNLGDVWTAVNNLLQGKVADGMSDVMRVAINSTLGFGGLLDIGSEAGLVKHKEDFGQTLGKWGVASGPYVVMPLLGPSTLRDTLATPVDINGDPWDYARPIGARNFGYGLRVVDQRAAVLDASNLLEEAALDRYVFVRDAYLQRRESKVRDGETSAKSSYDADDVSFPTPGADASSSSEKPASQASPGPAAGGAEPGTKAAVEMEQKATVPATSDAPANPVEK